MNWLETSAPEKDQVSCSSRGSCDLRFSSTFEFKCLRIPLANWSSVSNVALKQIRLTVRPTLPAEESHLVQLGPSWFDAVEFQTVRLDQESKELIVFMGISGGGTADLGCMIGFSVFLVALACCTCSCVRGGSGTQMALYLFLCLDVCCTMAYFVTHVFSVSLFLVCDLFFYFVFPLCILSPVLIIACYDDSECKKDLRQERQCDNHHEEYEWCHRSVKTILDSRELIPNSDWLDQTYTGAWVPVARLLLSCAWHCSYVVWFLCIATPSLNCLAPYILSAWAKTQLQRSHLVITLEVKDSDFLAFEKDQQHTASPTYIFEHQHNQDRRAEFEDASKVELTRYLELESGGDRCPEVQELNLSETHGNKWVRIEAHVSLPANETLESWQSRLQKFLSGKSKSGDLVFALPPTRLYEGVDYRSGYLLSHETVFDRCTPETQMDDDQIVLRLMTSTAVPLFACVVFSLVFIFIIAFHTPGETLPLWLLLFLVMLPAPLMRLPQFGHWRLLTVMNRGRCGWLFCNRMRSCCRIFQKCISGTT